MTTQEVARIDITEFNCITMSKLAVSPYTGLPNPIWRLENNCMQAVTAVRMAGKVVRSLYDYIDSAIRAREDYDSCENDDMRTFEMLEESYDNIQDAIGFIESVEREILRIADNAATCKVSKGPQ